MGNFNHSETKVLSEIFRRLNYFHKGNTNKNLMYLALPSEAKKIKKHNLITPISSELPRVYNWYKLTDAGKKFFGNYVRPISDKENTDLFNGSTTTFNKALLK